MPRGQLTPEQRERQRAALRARNWRPASGMPAAGAGWGGEARGAGKGGAHAPQVETKKRNRGLNAADATGAITTGTADEMVDRRGTSEGQQNTLSRQQRIAENCERMRGVLLDVATDADAPHQAKVNAAMAYLNREEGMPVQRNVNLNADVTKSDAELYAELAELDRRAAAANQARDVASPVPSEPSGILH